MITSSLHSSIIWITDDFDMTSFLFISATSQNTYRDRVIINILILTFMTFYLPGKHHCDGNIARQVSITAAHYFI